MASRNKTRSISLITRSLHELHTIDHESCAWKPFTCLLEANTICSGFDLVQAVLLCY